MKNSCFSFLLLLFVNWGFGQDIKRNVNEDLDQFVKRIIGGESVQLGAAYEYQLEGNSIILYFEISSQAPIHGKMDPNNLFKDTPTVTLFKALHSDDEVNFNLSVVDTLDINTACCPCHLPAVVDSVFMKDGITQKELVVLQTNPVKFDCSSITTHYALLYEDVLKQIISNNLPLRPSCKVGYYPNSKNPKKEIINRIQKEIKAE